MFFVIFTGKQAKRREAAVLDRRNPLHYTRNHGNSAEEEAFQSRLQPAGAKTASLATGCALLSGHCVKTLGT